MDIMDNIRWDYEEIKGTPAEEWLKKCANYRTAWLKFSLFFC